MVDKNKKISYDIILTKIPLNYDKTIYFHWVFSDILSFQDKSGKRDVYFNKMTWHLTNDSLLDIMTSLTSLEQH